MRLTPLWVVCATCLVACACAASAQVARQWIRFDGGVEASPGLTFGFSRPTAVYDLDGRLLDPDTPRFQRPTLLCAVPERDVLLDGAVNVLGAGMSSDGTTPLCVVSTAATKRLSVHVGEGSVERAFVEDDWSASYSHWCKDGAKDNSPNLLVGQTGVNGGTADVPNLAFSLSNGGAVHNGLIVVGCDVLQLDGDAWRSRRAALAYTTVERLGGPDPWIIAAVGPATDPLDDIHGSPWSLSAFAVSQGEVVVVWSDYRMSVKTGGAAYATRFARSSGSWLASDTVQLDRSETPYYTEHWHGGGLIRHADGRESYLISTGDGIGDNRLIALTRPAGGGWAGPSPIPDTGVDERSRIYPVSADWTAPEVVWGGQGEAPSLRHNQAMSMIAADAACRELLCGTDETSAVVLRLGYDPDSRRPLWRTQYLPAATSWPGDGVLNFNIDGVPGGPYVGRIDASGASRWDADERETRLLFSPDGVHWGQCYVAGTPGSRKAVLDGAHVYIGGAPADGVGFRRVDVPAYRIVRPLEISGSRDNLLSDDIGAPSDPPPGVSVRSIDGATELPAGVPAPPCGMEDVFLIENASGTGDLGEWSPTGAGAIPSPGSAVLLRAWVYSLLPIDSADPAATSQLAFELYDSGKAHLDQWTGRLDFDAGAWTPVTLWAIWSNPDDPEWTPVVRLKASRANTDSWFRCLVAWEGLFIDAPTVEGHRLPPGGSGSSEEAVVGGLSCDGDWTMLVVAMVPDDQWDSRVGGGAPDGALTRSSHTPQLFALEGAGGDDSIRVLADPRAQGIVLRVDEDGETRSAETTGTDFWLRGSPVLCVLRSTAGAVTLDYSVAGSEPARLSADGPIQPERLRLGPDPIWIHSVELLGTALPDHAVERALTAMTLRCPADFDGNERVDTRDMIAFLNAWTLQDARADFNGDGGIDTLDVLAFLNAFAAGC